MSFLDIDCNMVKESDVQFSEFTDYIVLLTNNSIIFFSKINDETNKLDE